MFQKINQAFHKLDFDMYFLLNNRRLKQNKVDSLIEQSYNRVCSYDWHDLLIVIDILL